MSHKPLIGLTSNLTGSAAADGLVQGPCAYVEVIVAAGGLPVLVPPLADTALAAAVPGRLDGLLFTGGRDLQPARYGQAPHAEAALLDPRREAWDMELLARALATPGLPILGICLGLQQLNVALGGTLTQHVPDLGRGLEHRAPKTGDLLHAATVRAGTRLAAILGAGSIEVTTRHHQAVDRVAPDAVVAALAPDGLVEAIEGPSADRFVVGVQWHPERNPESRESRALFAAFVAACGSWRHARLGEPVECRTPR